MPKTYDEIMALPSGASFVRADMHIHSAESYDVHDASMTPEAIVDSGIAAGLDIISITDHNTITNTRAAVEYAATMIPEKILVIPGVEITSPEGHVLVYFDPVHIDCLERFVVLLNIKFDSQGSRTSKSIVDVVSLAGSLHGYCVAAHIDSGEGFEVGRQGFEAWKKDLLCQPALRGLEFRNSENRQWYSVNDPQKGPIADERRKYAIARSKVALIGSGGALARFTNSDAHSKPDFCAGAHVTRIKLSSRTFASFACALADPDSRVQIDAGLPQSISRIQGMSIDGGFLDGTSVHFAPNLNVFIGGRGTGKSTALRALGFALGLMDFKDGSPYDCVTVYCEDAAGVQYRYTRNAGQDPIGRVRDGKQISSTSNVSFRIEYFSQGELGDVAKQSLSDRNSLQSFLDRHIAFGDLFELEKALTSELREVGRQLAQFRVAAAERAPLVKALAEIEAKLLASEESKIKTVASVQNRLTSERALSSSILTITALYRKGVALSRYCRDFKNVKNISGVEKYFDDTADSYFEIQNHVRDLDVFLREKDVEIALHMKQTADTVDGYLKSIAASHADLNERMQEYVAKLRSEGLAGSIAEFNELSNQKSAIVASVSRIDSQSNQRLELEQNFAETLLEVEGVRGEITDRRKAQLGKLNEMFGATIGRYRVRITVDSTGMYDEYKAFIDEQMHGSNFRSSDMIQMCCATTPQELAVMIEAKDRVGLKSLTGINEDWCDEIFKRLGSASTLLVLHVLWKPYLPKIRVWETNQNGKEIDFRNLSDGQKNTVLLTVALLSEQDCPLVIDQPEDDLDNRFIADTVVTTLRRVKERRQVIIVTHNANIAVLADSEQIVAMAHTETGGEITSRGSIDDQITKAAVQDCLEGGSVALKRRVEMYG